jgi:hypothetical protein
MPSPDGTQSLLKEISNLDAMEFGEGARIRGARGRELSSHFRGNYEMDGIPASQRARVLLL